VSLTQIEIQGTVGNINLTEIQKEIEKQLMGKDITIIIKENEKQKICTQGFGNHKGECPCYDNADWTCYNCWR
jgi:hypothetical protein